MIDNNRQMDGYIRICLYYAAQDSIDLRFYDIIGINGCREKNVYCR